MSSPTPCNLDAEALYAALRQGVRGLLGAAPDTALVGIWSGGAWLAARLHADLGLPGEPGVISSALHRDDFGERGLAAGGGATKLPFAIDGQRILLIDDVLYTGRTIRAVDQRAVRLRPPGQRGAGGAGRPRWARVADRAGVRRRARRAGARRSACRWRAPTTGASRSPSSRRMRLMLSRRNPQLNRHGELIHLLSIEGLPQGGADADPRHRGHLPVGQRPRRQEGAAAARQERLQPVLREQHAHPHHLRDRRQAPVGRRHQPRHRALVHRQGREPARHHRQPVGDARRHVRRAPQRERRAVPDRAALRAACARDQRRRRPPRAPDAGRCWTCTRSATSRATSPS